MLGKLEHVIAGISAVCIVVLIGVYAWLGTPSTQAVTFLPEVREVRAPKAPASAGRGGKAPAKPVLLTQEDKTIVEQLKKQGARVRSSVTRKTYDVPVPLFEAVSKKANWTRQLEMARSSVIRTKAGDTRLKLSGIQENSYLKRFGIQDNDIIDLIDGEILEFSENQSTQLYSKFQEKLDKLRSGEAISVTISRGSTPIHLEFKLPK